MQRREDQGSARSNLHAAEATPLERLDLLLHAQPAVQARLPGVLVPLIRLRADSAPGDRVQREGELRMSRLGGIQPMTKFDNNKIFIITNGDVGISRVK